MSELGNMDLQAIRAERASLQQAEDAVSYVRRIAQGRIDLARDEQRRRSEHAESVNVERDLAGLFGREHGGGSTRPPRETSVPVDHELVRELDLLCEEVGFGSLATLDDASIDDAVTRLVAFESRCSVERRRLFDRIDALTKELVSRYKDGGASVDSLLEG
jgi:hypothetical protein